MWWKDILGVLKYYFCVEIIDTCPCPVDNISGEFHSTSDQTDTLYKFILYDVRTTGILQR